MRHLRDQVVVITGASSGIGRATALKVAKGRGAVVLVARSERALKQIARECADSGARVIYSVLDVADLRSMKRVARKAVEEFGRIDVWINNAGVSLFARFEEAPPDVYQQVIETNFFGYINGARAMLPYFREQGHGILINVSSAVGKVGSPYVSAYTASKFAINGWSESLRMELLDVPNIKVCTILAASVDTRLFQHAGNYTGRAVKPLPPVYSPEVVAKAIIRCTIKPQPESYVGKSGAALSALRAIAPAMVEKTFARQVDREHFKNEAAAQTAGNLFEADAARHTVDGGWGGKRTARAGTIAGSLLAIGGLGAAAALWGRDGTGAPLKKVKKKISKAKRNVPDRFPTRLEKLQRILQLGAHYPK